MIAALLAMQAAAGWAVSPSGATVGDTVRLIRRVAVPLGAEVRVAPLASQRTLEPLGEPTVRRGEGAADLTYRVALFEPGRQAVAMPDIELMMLDGRVETVFGDTAWVEVHSVLPAGDSLPPPAASRGPLARSVVRWWPLGTLLGLTLTITGVWGWWRRRVAPRPAHGWSTAEPAPAPLQRWMTAGELRAVAASVADRVREAIAERVPAAGRHLDTESCLAVLERERPEWPLRDLGGVLRELERARFAPAVPGDAALLVDEAEGVLRALDVGITEGEPA